LKRRNADDGYRGRAVLNLEAGLTGARNNYFLNRAGRCRSIIGQGLTGQQHKSRKGNAADECKFISSSHKLSPSTADHFGRFGVF